jgi:hypothetical protein
MDKLISIVIAAAFAVASGAAFSQPAKPPVEKKPLNENQKKEIKMSRELSTANPQQAATATINKKDPPKKK